MLLVLNWRTRSVHSCKCRDGVDFLFDSKYFISQVYNHSIKKYNDLDLCDILNVGVLPDLHSLTLINQVHWVFILSYCVSK